MIDEYTEQNFHLLNVDDICNKSNTIPPGKHLDVVMIAESFNENCNIEKTYGNLDQNSFHKAMDTVPSVKFYEFHNVILAGQGVLIDDENRIFCSESLHMDAKRLTTGGINPNLFKYNISNNSYSLTHKLKIIEVNDICIPISRPGEAVYGHWLVDILPRISLAQMLGIKVKVVVTVHIPSYAREMLSILGVHENDIITYEPMREVVKLKTVYYPSYLRNLKGRFSPLAVEFNRRFLSFINQEKTKTKSYKSHKIFVSRGTYNKKQSINNIDDILKIAIKMGLEVVEPHTLSVLEQIKLFSEATLVVGEYGSALHNTMFSRHNIKVVILQSELTKAYVQHGIGKLLGHSTDTILGKPVYIANVTNQSRSFEIDTVEFKICLKKCLAADKIEESGIWNNLLFNFISKMMSRPFIKSQKGVRHYLGNKT